MAKMFQVYGIGQALIPVLPPPIPFITAPTSNQTNYEIGQLVFTPPTSPTAFYLYAGGGSWVQFASNSGDILSVTGTANQILATTTAGNVVLSLIGPYTPATYTAHGVLLGEGTGSIVATAAGTSGQLFQSGGASADPAYTTSTYPVTNAINTLLYASAANTMSALATANNGALVTSSAGVPSILAGPGTTGNILQSNAAAAPSFSTATYPSTTTINQINYSSAANVVSGLATANNGVLSTNTTGVPVITALANGQVLIGQGAAAAPAAVYQSNIQNTYVPKFTGIPSMSASSGGVAAVTINTFNIWSVPQWGAQFEQYNTTVASAIAPTVSATAGQGINIDSIGAGNAKSIEITEGNTVNCKNAFVVGTSAAFFVQASFNIAVLADVADVYVGFRKVQTYQATIPAGYTDYATLGVHSTLGLVESQTQVGSGGNVLTTSGVTITAATNFSVRVNVSATGVVTYAINGSPATTTGYTFTNALTVVPYLLYTSAAGAHAEVDLVAYQCGLQ